MKKFNLLLLLGFTFLFGIINVNAMTLKPSGDSQGKRGGQITVYITLNRSESEKSISAIDGKFSYDESILSLVSSDKLMGDGWTSFSGVSNNGTFSYANLTFDKLITNTSQNIFKVVFKIADDAKYGNTTISVSNPNATDEVGDGVAISGGSHTVKVLSDINTLTGISVTGATFTFEENTTSYDLEIDSDNVTIEATKKDSGSTLSGDVGNKKLNYGKNTFNITVKSESGVSKVYTLNITRPDHRNKDNSLSNLTISEGTLKFNKDTINYNVDVKANVDKIKIEATLNDEKASFVSGYGSREVKLNIGKNTIEVRVKAENESVKVYKINVTREDNRSKNNFLSELSVSNGNIDFDKNQTEYRLAVLYEVEEIEVTAKTEDSKAKYEVDMPSKLEIGENTIIIKVTAENGIKREYKIIVERKEESEKLSDNNSLSSLKVNGYEIDFNSSIYEYNLKIKDETSLEIKYEQEDKSSTVEIRGNQDLHNGSVISINVTSESGITNVYKINIEKEESNNLMLYIIICGVILILLVLIIIIVSKNKNKPKTDEVNNNNNFSNTDDMAIKQNMMYQQPMVNNNYVQNGTVPQNVGYDTNVQNTNNQNNGFF